MHGVALPLVAALRAALPLAAVALATPAQASSLSGTAQLRVSLPLPPDAVFEAVLLDAALADAPARELGRFRQQPAGQPPFRFTIPYRESDLAPGGRYAVRATVRQCEQLLFTTDTVIPVLGSGASTPLRLQLVPVGSGRPVGSRGPGAVGCLPASWRGDLPNGADTIRWQVDLAADGTFQMRQALLNQPTPNSFDDIGRWRLESPSNRLLLRGGREAPVFLQPLEKGKALRKLDPEGRIRSRKNDRLERLAVAKPIDPRLHLLGLFRYLADAPSLELCATGHRLPVAMEGDYLKLEKAYLRALPPGKAGQPLLVNLEGLITQRPSMEPFQGPVRTLVVERFVGVHPGRGCPQHGLSASEKPAHAPGASPELRGPTWRLEALHRNGALAPIRPTGRLVELRLATDSNRLNGSGGCNRLMGCFGLAGDQLRLSQLRSTNMACPPEAMKLEKRVVEALEQERRWSLDKGSLLLRNGRGETLLVVQVARHDGER